MKQITAFLGLAGFVLLWAALLGGTMALIGGCASSTPVAAIPTDQAQRSDDLSGRQVTINNNGGVLFYGAAPDAVDWSGSTLSGGETSSASSTRQGATEQTQDAAGTTGSQTAEAQAEGTFDIDPGGL